MTNVNSQYFHDLKMKSKNQFDDFDNIQELDKNKDWTILFAPNFLGQQGYGDGKTWLVFPDLKECEIARQEWAGKQYNLATFTTIEVSIESHRPLTKW